MRVRHRLLWRLTASGLVGAALVTAGALVLLRATVRERSLDRLRAETALVAEWAGSSAAGNPQDLAVRAARQLDARVTLVAADGTVLGDSSTDSAGLPRLENHLTRPEIAAARVRGSGEDERLSASTNFRLVYSARLVDGHGPIRFVRLAQPIGEAQAVPARSVWLLAALVLGTVAVLVLLGYRAVRRLSRPIEFVTRAVERSETGDAGLDLPDGGGEELERLAQAVRSMRQAQVLRIEALEAERVVLSSVVAGMREGLLLVGSDQHIELANPALLDVLDLSFDPRGQPLAKVVRHPTVIRDVEAALARGVETRDSELRQPDSGRSFQLQVTPLGTEGHGARHALALFFDVTRLERLDAVRREFVANVSHELRTPLTSIKAFVEMLQDGDIDNRENAKRFLEIIRKHADRMGDLIEDLTDLSLIETGAIALEPREMDAAEIVRGVLEHLQPLADSRGVHVVSELPSPFPIAADRRRFEQMLTNLVDNAVKFSNRDGRVWIRGERSARSAVLCVEDEGIGIPMESMEKVFHRFYQENRDRSRELGGTGLGLAIVKHLMRLHGGRVRVESELGQGSRFYLEFPGDRSIFPPRKQGPPQLDAEEK